ncbi:hypothetical protein BGZ47_007638 [Haplosporangium gracile]|nr:hypothetical protein BGZ47_007638 [Haplosporangium gracile]
MRPTRLTQQHFALFSKTSTVLSGSNITLESHCVAVSGNSTSAPTDDSASDSQSPDHVSTLLDTSASTLLDTSASTLAPISGHMPRAPRLWGIDIPMHQMEHNTAEVAPGHPRVCHHEGYELERLDDFSQQYGSCALDLLESIKYGFPLRDHAIPSPKDIELFRISCEGRDGVEYFWMNYGDIAAGIDEAIKYLRPDRMSSREAFERRAAAGELRSTFLKDVKESETIYPDGSGGLGYLVKGATPTGQTTWLCYTHHQAIYDTYALMNVKRAIAGGFEYNEAS